ncbi:hypothetical protein CAL26_01205 [Bordetella genomosp. 9]|uniref:ABC transporter substrate-binding protein n=2 Tax=Bordetella genomosp. 9 TaxID=1416803 RepID=A0A261RM36_9BORD|nr:hypothetical protein CAL26_01205 [Bordetella genomosp. 9]
MLAATAGTAHAVDYPTRTVQIIAPFTAGGALDIAARALTQALGQELKQTFVVVNKTGASGNIGASEVVRAAPDGYTLLMTPDSSIAANPSLYGKRMDFDPLRDLKPVTSVMSFGQILVVNPKLDIDSLEGFIKYAKEHGVTYGSAGVGQPGHLAMELLVEATGIKARHIPYKGMSQALTDIVSGQVDCGYLALPGAIQFVKSGQLIPLAVSGSARSPLTPDIPTIAESGFPAATIDYFYSLLAPRATPDAIVNLLAAKVQEALKTPQVVEFMRKVDFQPVVDTPAQALKRLQDRTKVMSKLVQERALTID